MIGKMTCRATRRRLPGYVGGELADRQVRRVAAHLAGCQRCGHECAQLKEALGALRRAARTDNDRQAKPAEVSAEAAWRAVRGRLAAAGVLTGGPSSHPPPRVRIERPRWQGRRTAPVRLRLAATGAAALAAAAGVVVGLWLASMRLPGAGGRSATPHDETPVLGVRQPYQWAAQPPFALENAPRVEAGAHVHHLPGTSHREEAPGEAFVLEQVTYDPGDRHRMPF